MDCGHAYSKCQSKLFIRSLEPKAKFGELII